MERVHDERDFSDLESIIRECKENKEAVLAGGNGHSIFSTELCQNQATRKPKIAVVGSGPSGLFAALVLAQLGADVTLIERGQPVERRGRDIGALIVRRILELESNFCFGEVCTKHLDLFLLMMVYCLTMINGTFMIVHHF